MFFAAGVELIMWRVSFIYTRFKALLFLGAGSIIHAFKDEQDRNMGGVRKTPYTYVFMLLNFSINWISFFIRLLFKGRNN